MSKPKRRREMQTVVNALDYFVAGVPPLGNFQLEIEHLDALVGSSKEGDLTGLNPTAEVSLIGLSAYFEAFCKAHFAALVNICPETLKNFVERRQNATVNLRNIMSMRGQVASRLGNLISEEHDFGSAREINGMYQDLLRITPFSASEANDYAKFLSDRNLLVHHGGVYTFRYSSQRFVRRTAPGLAHWDSLVVGKNEFRRWRSFLLRMAKKIATTSRTALNDLVARERMRLSAEQKRAIGMLS